MDNSHFSSPGSRVIVFNLNWFYNVNMKNQPSCGTNKVAKWIRIILSMGIIGAGIYYKNWIGLLGIITLISAFTGACPFSLRFDRESDFRLKK